MAVNWKKTWTWIGVGFGVLFIANRPDEAANVAKAIGGGVMDIVTGGSEFISELVSEGPPDGRTVTIANPEARNDPTDPRIAEYITFVDTRELPNSVGTATTPDAASASSARNIGASSLDGSMGRSLTF